MKYTVLQFPEVKLQASNGHYLRGYFAELFKDKSDLFHNHKANGESIYRYPLVQYKIVRGVPTLIGLEDGAKLLVDLFTDIKEVVIKGHTIPLSTKSLDFKLLPVGVQEQYYTYRFVNPWMALSQKNYQEFLTLNDHRRSDKLQRLLTGNMISFFKGIDFRENQKIVVKATLKPIVTQFKNNKMMAFKGIFESNVMLPSYIGLGKSVARGYGTIELLKHNH